MIYNRGWQRSARFADQKDWPARHFKNLYEVRPELYNTFFRNEYKTKL